MNNKKNQPSQKDSPHSYLASVPRANDVADAGISRRGFPFEAGPRQDSTGH